MNQKGITLIALVITIIVLGILAGVTLRLAIGNKGLVENSKTQVEDYEEQAAIEEIRLAIGAWNLSDDEKTIENFEEYLKTEFGSDFKGLEKDAEGNYKTDENGNYLVLYKQFSIPVHYDDIGFSIGTSTGGASGGSSGGNLGDDFGDSNETQTLAVGSYVTYSAPYGSYTMTTAQTGYSSSQTFNTTNYTGTWRVLYNDSTNGIQIVSSSSVGNLKLQGKTGYNNVNSTLNAMAGYYINDSYATSARALGTNPANTDGISEPATSAIYEADWDGLLKPAEELGYYDSDSDITQLEEGNIKLGAEQLYLCERRLCAASDDGRYDVGISYLYPNGFSRWFCTLLYYSGGWGEMYYGPDVFAGMSSGFAPVVKLKSGITIKSGTGTESDPYVLNEK